MSNEDAVRTASDMTNAWGAWPPAVRDDPFPTLDEVRGDGTVQPVQLADGHDAWLVLGYDSARQAMNDPRISKDMQAALADDPDVVAEGLPGPAFARHMLNVDPPDHTRLRRLVSSAFTPGRVARLEPWIQTITDRLLDELARRGADTVVDLVDGFAAPLPFEVIGQLLGVPPADRADLHRWFQTLLRPWAGDPPPEARTASDAIVGYLETMVERKQRHPGDDLTSALVMATEDGDRLTRQELLSTLFQLVVAGHDTTTSLIGNGVVALLDHPDELDAVRQNPPLLSNAIEELVRYDPPGLHATFRYTTEPVELDGVTIPAGAQVLVCLAGANRDPSHFARPNTLDTHRPRSEGHLGFGHGTHYCLGAPLARLEGRVALGTLLTRFPDTRLAVPRSRLEWGHGDGVVLRGLSEVPVVLGHDTGIHASDARTEPRGPTTDPVVDSDTTTRPS